MKRKRIFLTGATGTMGGAALAKFLEQPERFDVVILALPIPESRARLARYQAHKNLTVVWGDLTHYEDVLKCVSDADYVLHPAAFVAPAADHDPETAWKINVGSAANIVKAIWAQPNPHAIKLVSIGTVAETGDRLPPIHVGRTGDPLKPSIFDMYACSKIAAERIVAESGLRYWVSLRQTFIATANLPQDPIMFHQPINTCLELVTAREAGLVLVNACADDLPDSFWRRFYNIGGGPKSRLTYLDLIKKALALSGIDDYTQVYKRKWFALRNFHCHWFEDAYILNQYLRHQVDGADGFYRALAASNKPIQVFAARLAPKHILKDRAFRLLAEDTPDCTQYWFEHKMDMRISAFYKSRATFESIPDWGVDMPEEPDWYNYRRLDHGYDESKPTTELDLLDMQGAAHFRGGVCLSTAMKTGDLFARLRWQCAFGHEFEATPNLVLKGGHWCPECAPPGWNYDEQARRNPFFAQVWYPNHDPTENNVYPSDCCNDILV